jgi:predicted RND superfamily exporter protein
MIRIFGRDGRNAMLLTLIIVFLLLWVDFKSWRHAAIGMVPLGIGILWLVGVMNLAGMQFSIMTFMGLPMIIGIGIDDGVHILHRWRNEGKGKTRTIFSSTGKAIFLTSLTTMFAFGSLGWSAFPAWAQFGMPLFIGVGTCFLTSIFILPGIIGWMEKRTESN